jgi:hypothetical protein
MNHDKSICEIMKSKIFLKKKVTLIYRWSVKNSSETEKESPDSLSVAAGPEQSDSRFPMYRMSCLEERLPGSEAGQQSFFRPRMVAITSFSAR